MSQKNVIFISGRFRSGTSMLWNLFEQHPDYHAWYEPLHSNLLEHIRHVKPQKDHLGIQDYWKNYRKIKGLNNHYKSDFGIKRLLMHKHDKWESLKNYIDYLISQSEDKIPVIKFNRMDLRLSWLKNNFPGCKIINIRREPFPLWVSCRKHIENDADKLNESYADAYELMQWSVELAKDFPMLQKQNSRNSYFRHYFIWKLSNLMADSCSDLILRLEKDFFDSKSGVNKIGKLLNWDTNSVNKSIELIRKPESLLFQVSPQSDIVDTESRVDKLFVKLGLNKLFPSALISSVRHEYMDSWSQYPYEDIKSIHELLFVIKNHNDELTKVLNR